jgi:hypothetical protein
MTMRAVALMLACGFVLASCGNSGEGGGDRGDEAAIEKTIAALAKTDNPNDCRKLATPRFHEQTGKSSYEAVLTICEEATIDPLVEDAKKVTVSGVEVEGDSATAVASYVGSALDGQTVRLALVERDGQWKHDELLGFVDLDVEKLATEMGRELMLMAATPSEAESATCVMNRLRKLSAETLEAMYVGNDPDPLLELARSCASRSNAL